MMTTVLAGMIQVVCNKNLIGARIYWAMAVILLVLLNSPNQILGLVAVIPADTIQVNEAVVI
jgi:hypothetical protein